MSASAALRSRPDSCSISMIECSKSSFSLSSSSSISVICSSPSISLVAANREEMPTRRAWSSMTWETEWIQRWTGPSGQKSSTFGATLFFAVSTAWRISSETPSFLAAEIGTTGMPRRFERAGTSIVPPPLRTSSIMLRASTVGIRSSSSWRVR